MKCWRKRSGWFTKYARVFALLLCATNFVPAVSSSEETAERDFLLRGLETAVLQEANAGLLLRKNGQAFAIDNVLFLLYAVESRNRSLFDSFLVPFSSVFLVPAEIGGESLLTVGWKYDGDAPPDASGTTETILAAKAFWNAGILWEDALLLQRSLSLVKGYLAHQSGEGRSWQIRNYYNYGTRAFATNSYALGYFPDFLFEVACSDDFPDASEAAGKSLRFLRNAALPNGFFSSSFDPELRTLFPEDEFSFHFSPDFRVKPGDSAFIALNMIQSDEEIPRRTLAYLKVLWPALPDTIYGFLSVPLSENAPGISTGHLGGVYRLALRLDRNFAREVRPEVYERGKMLLQNEHGEAWTWDAVNILLALAEERAVEMREP
jgi:hypothetical protein